MNEPRLAGSLNRYNFAQADNVWSTAGVSPTILAYNQGQIGHQINILEDDDDEPSGEGDSGANEEAPAPNGL